MADSRPYAPTHRIVTARIRASIERRYELPKETDDVDRLAFQRWLLDVIPSREERFGQGALVELWYDDV